MNHNPPCPEVLKTFEDFFPRLGRNACSCDSGGGGGGVKAVHHPSRQQELQNADAALRAKEATQEAAEEELSSESMPAWCKMIIDSTYYNLPRLFAAC